DLHRHVEEDQSGKEQEAEGGKLEQVICEQVAQQDGARANGRQTVAPQAATFALHHGLYAQSKEAAAHDVQRNDGPKHVRHDVGVAAGDQTGISEQENQREEEGEKERHLGAHHQPDGHQRNANSGHGQCSILLPVISKKTSSRLGRAMCKSTSALSSDSRKRTKAARVKAAGWAWKK